MRVSQHSVSFRTYALAFAVALSPALMQTNELTCTPPTGDTTLSMLEFEVDGENQIVAFTSGQRGYDVSTTVDTAIVRAQSTDPAATVDYQWWAGSSFLGSGPIGIGGGEATLDVPVGQSTLRVYVRAPGGAYAHYAVNASRFGGLPCTEQGIRDAVAAGGGPYTFDCAGPSTVVTQTPILIDKDVFLDGGAGLTVDGNDSYHHIFQVAVGVTAELHGFVVTHSAVPPTLGWGAGGIWNEGTLTLTNSTVSGNYGIGLSSCPGWMRGCAGGYTAGGGVFNAAGAVLTLTDSVVSDNYADFGGGIHNPGTLTVMNSTVSGNVANWIGGGIDNSGSVSVTNSTVSGNVASSSGGGIDNSGSVSVTNSTVSGNVATNGNGLSDSHSSINDTVTLSKSIIDGDCFFIAAPLVSNGYNIESPGDTCGFDQATDQVDVTPAELNLGPPQNNGGPTTTHALGGGSVAIDWIPAAMCTVSQDQRGVTRPQGLACDVGAFELEQ